MQSRTYVQELRRYHDSILVGANTAVHDNPSLSIRIKNYKGIQPLRIIPDTKGRTKTSSHLFTANQQTVFLITNNTPVSFIKKIEKYNKQYILCQSKSDCISAHTIISKVQQQYDINSIFIEGGSHTFGYFFHDNLIDKHNVFIAPKILGDGSHALSPFSGPTEIKKMSLAQTLCDCETRIINDDVYICGYSKNSNISKLRKKLI
jgi:diaminohydroxyphosphoribosylaminopyrimidine deaminase/5-amino-6-(5-phosphoribosylamino)uracil reductase